jgi:anti-sigma factor RsiW
MEAAMLSCDEAERFIARAVDGGALDADGRAALTVHLDRCARCRAALETQRAVSAWLRLRPADRVSPDFLAQLSERLDEAAGWLGMADWRAWTLRLAPVAAVLALAILFGGSSLDSSVTIDEWTYDSADSGAALWQSGVSVDSALESLVIGEQPASGAAAPGVGAPK